MVCPLQWRTDTLLVNPTTSGFSPGGAEVGKGRICAELATNAPMARTMNFACAPKSGAHTTEDHRTPERGRFFASQKQDAPTKLAYAIIVLPRAPHNAPSRTFHTLNTPNSANPTLQQAARLMTLPRVPLHTPHLRMRAGATLCAPRAPRGAKTPPFVALPAPKQAVAPPSSNGRRIVFQVEVTHTPSTDVPFPDGTRFNNNRIFGPSNGQRTRRATRAWRHLGDQAEKTSKT